MSKLLAEVLSCRPSEDFVVALKTPQQTSALISDSYAVAWHEARGLAELICGEEEVDTPPLEHQQLLREGGSMWSLQQSGEFELVVGRLYRHVDVGYREPRLDLATVTGLGGRPVLFIAVASGILGQRQVQAMRGAVETAIEVRRYPARDLRDAFPRSQHPFWRPFGQTFVQPILGEAVEEARLAQVSVRA